MIISRRAAPDRRGVKAHLHSRLTMETAMDSREIGRIKDKNVSPLVEHYWPTSVISAFL